MDFYPSGIFLQTKSMSYSILDTPSDKVGDQVNQRSTRRTEGTMQPGN